MFTGLVYWSVSNHYGWLQSIAIILPAEPPLPVEQPSASSGIGSVDFLITGGVVIAMVAVFIYVVRTLPSTILRAGDAVVRKPAEALVPFVLKQTTPVSKKRRLEVTMRLIIIIKVILVLLPLIILIPLQVVDYKPLEPLALWIVVSFSAVMSALWFTLEYILIRILRVAR